MRIRLVFYKIFIIICLVSSIRAQVSNKATCKEKESKTNDLIDPIIIKTCFYKNYKAISKGYPDYKGRYSYEYTLFKKQKNGSYIKIKNSTFFNENKNQFLSLINSKIEKDYLLFSNDPDTKDCFNGDQFTPFDFEQLGIIFDDNNIIFNVYFGLSSACMSVDGTIISFELSDIQKFIND